MSFDQILSSWQRSWEWQQAKKGLPCDEQTWKVYIDSLSMSDVLFRLSEHAEKLKYQTSTDFWNWSD